MTRKKAARKKKMVKLIPRTKRPMQKNPLNHQGQNHDTIGRDRGHVTGTVEVTQSHDGIRGRPQKITATKTAAAVMLRQPHHHPDADRGHVTATITETVPARGHGNVRVFDVPVRGHGNVRAFDVPARGHEIVGPDPVIATLPVFNPQETVEVIGNGIEIVFVIVTIVGHTEAVVEAVLALVQDHQKTVFVVRGRRLTRPNCWPLPRKMPLGCLVQIT